MNAKADKRADVTAPDTDPVPETLPHDLRFPANFEPEPLEGQLRAARADLHRFIAKHELATSMGRDLTPVKKAMSIDAYNRERRRRASIIYTLLQLQRQQEQQAQTEPHP